MEFQQIVLMSIQIIHVISKKYDSSSEESIENLLYFKDCKKDELTTTTSKPIIRLAGSPKPKAMDCPFPKMCCSLTCGGNECGNSSPFSVGRQMEPVQIQQSYPTLEPMGGTPQLQPQGHPQGIRGRKKKVKHPMKMQMQPPIGGRRNFDFTKERIKSLINQDDDIRKILKDLVRVTMKKVDLVDMINARNKALKPPELENIHNGDENTYDDEDDDLEK